MSSKVSLSRNGAWSWRQSVTSNKVNLKTQHTPSSVCACLRMQAHSGPPSTASPLLASAGIRTLSKDANRALEGHLVWTWILRGKIKGDILVEDLGKSWRFSGRQLAHFVKKGSDVLGPRWEHTMACQQQSWKQKNMARLPAVSVVLHDKRFNTLCLF